MIQKDHFNKIQKRIKQHKRSLLKKATPPDGGEGARLRYFAPEGKLCKSLPFKSFDNAPRRTKRQKGHCMELQGIALFWFAPKFTPSKIFEPRKFFPACPIFANKIFSVFNEKIGKKVCALHARKRAQSVGRYQPMSLLTRFFRAAKKS